MNKPLLKLDVPGGGTKVLLHSCCAPCSGAIIECMAANSIEPAVFFSNSNISTREEYDKRLAEVRRYSALFGFRVIDDEYDHKAWLDAVKGLEKEPERGLRCEKCFRFRLERAARFASDNGFGVLATSLASSRWKDLDQVNRAGEDACLGVPELKWWPQNWRKGGLQPRRNEIIREQGFYNQNYCGCEFSRRQESQTISFID